MARRFTKNDTEFRAGVSRRFSDAFSGNIEFALTPDDDFLAKWTLRGGISLRVLENGRAIGPTLISLDFSHRKFEPGGVTGLDPGITQYLMAGKLWVQARFINSFDPDDNHLTGWLLRGDWQALKNLRFFAGTAEAPESDRGIITDTRSYFGGFLWRLSDHIQLRADYARDDRENSYLRKSFTLGFDISF